MAVILDDEDEKAWLHGDERTGWRPMAELPYMGRCRRKESEKRLRNLTIVLEEEDTDRKPRLHGDDGIDWRPMPELQDAKRCQRKESEKHLGNMAVVFHENTRTRNQAFIVA